jgi:hypothetical protein
VKRLSSGAAVVVAAALVLVGIGVARSGGASAGRTPAGSPAGPVEQAASPAPPVPRAAPAPAASSPALPGPSAPASDAGPGPWGNTSALVAAEQLRLEVCDCDDLGCVAAANKRFAKALGEIDPRTSDPAAKAEMHAANQCIARLLGVASQR